MIWDFAWDRLQSLVRCIRWWETLVSARRCSRRDWQQVLGLTEPVSSPTFTIVQVYEDGRLPFYHFDVYRIGDVEEMDEIGYEDYVYRAGSVPDRVGEPD